MLKKITILILILLVSCPLFAFQTPYDSADTQTKELLTQIDSLIAEQKYQTAFEQTGRVQNEYILTKRIEIATSYYASSIMHKMFSFKNLAPGETLESVRKGEGTFTMTMFDPADEVKKFIAAHGKNPILDYALAVFYDSVYQCYGSNWLITEDELIDNIITYGQSGLDNGFYDSWILSELAHSYRMKRIEAKASAVYLKKEALGFNLTVDDNFNLGASLYYQGKPGSGLKYAIASIAGYEGNPSFQGDSYLLCAQMYTALSDFTNAEKFYKTWAAKIPNDYRRSYNMIYFYALQNKQTESVQSAKELYTYGPSYPSTLQMAMQMLYNARKGEWIGTLLTSLEKEYASDDHALENIYFHLAYYHALEGDKATCSTYINIARTYFAKNGELTDNIEQQFAAMMQ